MTDYNNRQPVRANGREIREWDEHNPPDYYYNNNGYDENDDDINIGH